MSPNTFGMNSIHIVLSKNS